MNLQLRAPCAAMLYAAALAAHAQSIYKCTLDGKITYADRPCPAGASASSTLEVPAPPAADPAAARDLKRIRKDAAALEKARLERDDRETRASDKAAHAAGVQRKKCDKLRLSKQWADDDVRRAGTANLEHARIKARRAADSLAMECGR